MKEAYKQAKYAFDEGEIPIGAVIVCNNKVIARAHNQSEILRDFTAHAEMIAFTAASDYLGGKYLSDCTLYVTLEPCLMCAGACYWAQIKKLVVGASDPKRGFKKVKVNILHPKTEIVSGIMAKECGKLITDFFDKIR
ncbi:MAG: nucleoside deaminase [Bacteroidetes bacterium]|nr:nucleoside deaminase [Bacteroidota bacterium]